MKKKVAAILSAVLIASQAGMVLGQNDNNNVIIIDVDVETGIQYTEKLHEGDDFYNHYAKICKEVYEAYNTKDDNLIKIKKIDDISKKYGLDMSGKDAIYILDMTSRSSEDIIPGLISDELIESIFERLREDKKTGDKDDTKKKAESIKKTLDKYKLNGVVTINELLQVNSIYNYEVIASNALDEGYRKETIYGGIDELYTYIVKSKNQEASLKRVDSFLSRYLLDYVISSGEVLNIYNSTESQQEFKDEMYDLVLLGLAKLDIVLNATDGAKQLQNILLEEIIEEANWRIDELFSEAQLTHNFKVNELIYRVNSYEKYGYKSKEEAVQAEAMDKIKFAYSDKEITEISSRIAKALSDLRDVDQDTNINEKALYKDVYEDFLGIVYDYIISDIKQYFVEPEILSRMVEYDKYGYSSDLESLKALMKEILTKSCFDNEAMKIISMHDYNKEYFEGEFIEMLEDNSDFYGFLNTVEFDKILTLEDENKDALISDFILDKMIEYHEKDIKKFISTINKNHARVAVVQNNIEKILSEYNMRSFIPKSEAVKFYFDVRKEIEKGQLTDEVKNEYFGGLPKTVDQNLVKSIRAGLTQILYIDYSYLVKDNQQVKSRLWNQLYSMKLKKSMTTEDIIEAFSSLETLSEPAGQGSFYKLLIKSITKDMANDLLMRAWSGSSEMSTEITVLLKRYNLEGRISLEYIKGIADRYKDEDKAIEVVAQEIQKKLMLN